MNVDLPLPITIYLDAVNTRDVDALDMCMTPDARITDPDDEQSAKGIDAIKAWFKDNCLQYNLHAEVVDSHIEAGQVIVTVNTAGDFPGSPLLFEYHFSLAGDRIANIDIRCKQSPGLEAIGDFKLPQEAAQSDATAAGMTVPEIVAALSKFDYVLPEAALYAAEARQEEITPHLLAALEKYTHADPDIDEANDNLILYAVYLLGTFRDIRALKIFRRIMERVREDWLALDDLGMMEDGTRLLASWAYSNPEALKPLVENRSYADIVRANALEAFICLYLAGAVRPETMRPYLQYLHDNILRRESRGEDGWLWYAWARCCIDCGFEEYYPLVKKAFEKEWIDPTISTWELEEQDIVKGREHILGNTRNDRRQLIGHVADELRGWYGFTEKARQDDLDRQAKWKRDRAKRERQGKTDEQPQLRDTFIPVGTIVNEKPKTKPNQPCPCGSGKKHKKCCGR